MGMGLFRYDWGRGCLNSSGHIWAKLSCRFCNACHAVVTVPLSRGGARTKSRAEGNNMIAASRKFCSLTDAAIRLGCSLHRLRKAIKMGLATDEGSVGRTRL